MKNNQLLFDIQGRVFTQKILYESILCACGGNINPAYFQMIDTELSELLVHLELWIDTQKKINKKQDNSGINIPDDMEWEEIE